MSNLSYFDAESEILYKQVPRSKDCKVKISFNLDFDIGQSYVTSKIEDREGNIRKLNIQPGIRGIMLQSDLIRLRPGDEYPTHVFVQTILKDSRILVRKLPMTGLSDWLLIFEEDLFLLAVKEQYEELEILG
ncbi:hypothetical protein [Candidatus Nitrosocosmicus franklandus]|uniref:Uncharacterized protein n=1 Tax=Candidatus Nitrosocosmicus franklandianus TaxID=1798806 RepID=A0A484ID16_9ARCH|nr:hypothetical protein [Candidatus Nitrosocosmicus franklandus]VFJ12884.1 conserved protein of unknown function [Candidatus Nitrosocosmicus franklandus]